MTENQTRWLTWVIMSLVTLAIALFFGVQYPMPEQPDEPPEPIALAANFSNPVDIEGSSSAAAPALTFEDDTDSGIFRSAADTLNIATGGTERLEIDSAAFSIVPPLELTGAADFASNVDIDGTLNVTGTTTINGGLMLKAADATAAFTATAANCGTTYFLNHATEFQTILPAISTVDAGCSFQFIVKAAPSGAHYTIVTGNSLENVLIGGINELEVDTGDDGPTSSADDTITFHDSPASAVGDYVYMISDGTSWYYRGQSALDGAVVPSQAD